MRFGSWKADESQIWQCRKLRSTQFTLHHPQRAQDMAAAGTSASNPPLHTTTASPPPCQETGELVYGESSWAVSELGIVGTIENSTVYENNGKMTCVVPTGSCGGQPSFLMQLPEHGQAGLHPLWRMLEASPQGCQMVQEEKPEGTDIRGFPTHGPGRSPPE